MKHAILSCILMVGSYILWYVLGISLPSCKIVFSSLGIQPFIFFHILLCSSASNVTEVLLFILTYFCMPYMHSFSEIAFQFSMNSSSQWFWVMSRNKKNKTKQTNKQRTNKARFVISSDRVYLENISILSVWPSTKLILSRLSACQLWVDDVGG